MHVHSWASVLQPGGSGGGEGEGELGAGGGGGGGGRGGGEGEGGGIGGEGGGGHRAGHFALQSGSPGPSAPWLKKQDLMHGHTSSSVAQPTGGCSGGGDDGGGAHGVGHFALQSESPGP